MKRVCLLLMVAAGVSGCDANGLTQAKEATFDRDTRQLVLPAPCPDWSQSYINHENDLHSNYGCAVNNNLAAQLEDPEDLVRGHGTNGPDAAITSGIIKQYRAGEIPAPLTPVQSSAGQ